MDMIVRSACKDADTLQRCWPACKGCGHEQGLGQGLDCPKHLQMALAGWQKAQALAWMQAVTLTQAATLTLTLVQAATLTLTANKNSLPRHRPK